MPPRSQPYSLPKRRAFCSSGDSPAKQKSKKPVRQLCGFLKQVQQEWPRLGRLASNLGQKGFLFVSSKANLVFSNRALGIRTPTIPDLLRALSQQESTLPSHEVHIPTTRASLCRASKCSTRGFLPEAQFLQKLGQASGVTQPRPVGWWGCGCHGYGLPGRLLTAPPPLSLTSFGDRSRPTYRGVQAHRGQRAENLSKPTTLPHTRTDSRHHSEHLVCPVSLGPRQRHANSAYWPYRVREETGSEA